MDSEGKSLSEQGSSEEHTSDLKSVSNPGQAEKLPSGLKASGDDETVGEATSCMQFPPSNAEPCGEDHSHQTVDGNNQGLIRLYKLQRIAQKTPVSTYKKRRRWLCEQLGLPTRRKRQSNILNLTEEEMQAKFEALVSGKQVSKDLKTSKTLDASMWHYPKFRSTVWGHLNADEEDGSHVIVKDLEKWHSHDVLYNMRFDGSKEASEVPLQGKHIVPNQGKGWSFREKQEGKGKVYGLPCMTQPKLQLYYTWETAL